MTLRLGLWGARADRSGLAIQSFELARHLEPLKVMGFGASKGPGEPNRDRPSDWHAYDGPYELTTDDDFWSVTEERAKAWLEGLDVVWGVETFYQDPFARWAAEAGVATIQHCNPEFFRFGNDAVARPTVVAVPTTWRLDYMKTIVPRIEVIPTPVATDRLPYWMRPLVGDRPAGAPLTFLHVIGYQAAHDRNGTRTVIEAIEHVTEPCTVVVRSQTVDVPVFVSQHGNVTLKSLYQSEESYADLYATADVLLLPRRYGGQCLPMQEALASGMPVVMSDLEPQRMDLPPDCLLDADQAEIFETQGGPVRMYDVEAVDLAACMDHLSRNRARVAELSEQAKHYRDNMSWDRWKPAYERLIRFAYERFHGYVP